MKQIRAEVSQSVRQFEKIPYEEQLKIGLLKAELTAYVETLKNASMSFFNQRQYEQCYEALTLLLEIEPGNDSAQEFLDIVWRKIQEAAAEGDSPVEEAEGALWEETSSGPSWLSNQDRTNHWRNRWFALVVGGVLLIGILAGLRTRMQSEPIKTVSLAIQSEPDSANVFMNGLLVGKTPLQLSSFEAGSVGVRFEKEGYTPITRQLVMERGEQGLLSVRLEKLEMDPNSLVAQREKAQALFDMGNLPEAGLICNAILQRDPQDSFALKLKESIHNYYFAPLVHEALDSQSADRPAETSTSEARRNDSRTSVNPSQPPIREVVKEAAPKIPPTVEPKKSQVKLERSTVASPASSPSTSGNTAKPQVSPSSAKPSSVPTSSPLNEGSPQKLDRASQEVIAQVQAKIQGKEFEQAKGLLSQLQNNLSAQSEWRTLTERLRVEEARQQGLAAPLVQKAESALISGRYITPPEDNVLLYCNRALEADPQNQRAQALKRDVIGRSVAQAKEWIEHGKFDEARLFYSSLNYLSQNDNHFPFSRQELQQELVKLEFTSYPVIHEHKLGNCRGRLRMNGYVVSFVPSQDSADGFSEKLKDITVLDAGDELKLKAKDKSYRFQPNTGQGKEATQKTSKAMYEQLMRLLAQKG
jgi:tetratricopeptide (TPR) repeat protein